MSKLLTPEDLRNTRQAMPTKAILALAQSYGFIQRNGGSHIRLKHKIHHDVTVGIVGANKTSVSQLRLADAIEEVQKRELVAEQAITDKFEQAADKKTATRLANIQQKLPHHIEAFYGKDDHIILRDKHAPQIGITLYSPAEDALLDNKTRYMDGLKRDFYKLLNRSDITLKNNPNLTGLFSHDIYNLEVTLPPYSEDQDPMEALYTYQAQIEEIDLDHAIRREELLKKPFIISDVMVGHTARRGKRQNHVTYIISDANKPLSFTFKTFSNQRVEGDGSVARISEAELIKLETVIEKIEKRIEAASYAQQLRPAA